MNDKPVLAPLTQLPGDIHYARDYEALARRFINASTYEYIAGGSGDGLTLAANTAAFAAQAIYPRVLKDVTAGHTRFTLAGREFMHPVLLAPVALQKLVHPLGELETARAAGAMHSCLVSSTLSTQTLEDIAKMAGPDKWFQLYFQPARAVTLDLVKRTEAAGYQAIVVTLDAALQAPGRRALQAGFHMPADCIAANLQGYPLSPPVNVAAGESRIFQGYMRQTPTWADLDWLLANTALPIWVKGVMHPDDARALQARGVTGLVVSNHGGRGLEGAPASLSVLPAIRAAVGDSYPLLFDSGIRSGSDIFKAIANGADAVMVGRLQIYALAVAGALGVAHVIRLLQEELELCMALAGCASLADIRAAGIAPV